MAHLAGTAGNVFVADLLLEDCEDTWTSGTNGTAAPETTIIMVGSGSAKCTIGAGIAPGNIIMYETMESAKNLSTYTHILCWAYSVPTTAAADYRIGIGTTAAGASPTTLVDVPALTATTWQYCHCTVVSGSPFSATTAGTIIGLESNANGANLDVIYLDDVRAAKGVAGVRSWTMDYTVDTIDTTDFVDGAATNAARTFIPGLSSWSGSFEAIKDGAPLSLFSQVGIELAESATVTQMWLGNIILTAIHPNVSVDGVITYTYDFEGTGKLEVAST